MSKNIPVKFAEDSEFEIEIEHDSETGQHEADQKAVMNLTASEQRTNDYREAGKRAVEFFQRGANLFKFYRGNKAMAFDCWMMALGWYDIAGHDSQVDLAAQHRVKRATITQCVKQFQARLGVPPMPGQRSLQACEKFKEARVATLAKTKVKSPKPKVKTP